MSDILVSGIAADGFLRVIGAETTQLVEDARVTHNMSATATAALGRMLTGTVLMAKEMKNETDKLTIQLKGKGPIGGMATVCRIHTKNGAAGALKDVIVTGANDVYVVENEDGKELLFPAIKECVLNVDVEQAKITVHIMPGLLD